jgi:hypothetical protein
MKTMKKALILMGAVFMVMVLSSAGGGGAKSGGSAPLEEITGLVWNWGTYADSDADSGNNGSSTSVKTEVEVDGVTAYHYTGAITNKFQYGYAGIDIQPGDDNTLAQLKVAKAFSFKVKGDGLRYAFKIPTNAIIKDGGHYETTFMAEEEAETITIPVAQLAQQSWAAPKRFNQADADSIQFQTTHNGKPGPFDLTVWDLKLYK